jgi:hypothetical protein
MEKEKMIIRTLVPNVMGLTKGAWLYYNPKDGTYEFSYTKEDNQSDIGNYYSFKSVSAYVDKETVEAYLGELFEYVTDPIIINRIVEDAENKNDEDSTVKN